MLKLVPARTLLKKSSMVTSGKDARALQGGVAADAAQEEVRLVTALRAGDHPVGLIRPRPLQGSADAEDQRSEGKMPTA